MDTVSLKALAKINLGLDVVGEREDGYHEVRMVMQSIHLYDRVEIRRTRSPQIKVETNLYYLPVDEDNLVYKAAKYMKEAFNIKEGVRITLQKFIPVAAGLAGGSSDAAAVLVGMNKLFKLGARQEQLMEIGARIGADVPFCVMRGTVLAEGIGEKLAPLSQMPRYPILIAKPGISVSTKMVYDNLKLSEGMHHPDIDGLIAAIESRDLDQIAGKMENILETVTVPRYPVINEIKKVMLDHGARIAMMSGSGPSVFGIFPNEKEIRKAYEALKACDFVKNLYTSEIHNNRR